MTPEQLADLRRKAEAATDGTWSLHVDRRPAFIIATTPYGSRIWTDSMGLAQRTPGDDSRNAEFMAAANPATLLALLDHVAALETQLGIATTVADNALRERDELAQTNEILARQRDQYMAEVNRLRALDSDPFPPRDDDRCG